MVGLCLATLLLGVPQTSVDTSYRWFSLTANLQQPPDLDKAIRTIDAAANDGYNGVVFRDPSLDSLTSISPAYKAALEQAVAEARKNKMEFIPSIAAIGDSENILDRNPSLAESMPCRDVRFTITNGQLKPSDPVTPVVNGGLETFAGELPTGFTGAHGTDMTMAADNATHHGGAMALRVDGLATALAGKGGVSLRQSIAVRPWHQYRLSVWTKATATKGAKVLLNALGAAGQFLNSTEWHNTPDWVKNDTVFDSLGESQITMEILVQPLPNAKIWIDDLTLEDVGIMNVTRRDDCPVVIKGDDGIFYNENIDVAQIADPFHVAGMGPGHIDGSHAIPFAVPGTNGRLHEGQTVLMDYYAAVLANGVPVLCVNEPKSKALIKADIKRVIDLIHPKTLLFDVADVRSLGWDPACEGTGKNGGEMLGGLIRDEEAMAKSFDPSIQIATYGDMFNPSQNSLDQYYLMKSGTTGSLRSVPKDVIIVNGDFAHASQSLTFFAQAGYKQILWGYRDDHDAMAQIVQWQKLGAGVKGIQGFGYATQVDDYSHLADFVQAATGK